MMDGVTDIHPTIEADISAANADSIDASRSGQRHGLAFWATVSVVAVTLGGLLLRVGSHELQKQRGALNMMREEVQGSLAPGEIVLVDDRLLAWALRRDADADMQQSVWTVSQDVPVSSLLARMDSAKRSEVVVVAAPDDRLIRHLDEAGFSVAQEVGWVPWDLKGNGLALLGRGKMRIYFAVAPKPAAAGRDAAKK
jgi:hypothetical protein